MTLVRLPRCRRFVVFCRHNASVRLHYCYKLFFLYSALHLSGYFCCGYQPAAGLSVPVAPAALPLFLASAADLPAVALVSV